MNSTNQGPVGTQSGDGAGRSPASSSSGPAVSDATLVVAELGRRRPWWLWALAGVLVLLVIAWFVVTSIIDEDADIPAISSCVDTTLDADGEFNLTNVSVERTSSDYIFTAGYSGPADGRETTVTWSVRAGDGDGYQAYEVSGETYPDGQSAAGLFAFIEVRETDIANFDIEPNSVNITVPTNDVGELAGKPVSWKVVVVVDGVAVDQCAASLPNE